jgi:hypothetical protein
VTGIDDEKAARVLLIVGATPFIFAFDHCVRTTRVMKSERPAVAGRLTNAVFQSSKSGKSSPCP